MRAPRQRLSKDGVEIEEDPFRDTHLRFMGYANEVGEAFRPLVPSGLVAGAYGMSIAYVLADAYDKMRQAKKRGATQRQVLIKVGDVFIWQALASVLLSGFAINRITWLCRSTLIVANATKSFTQTIPTCVSLSAIPFIMEPIDKFVNRWMQRTYRHWVKDD